MSAIRFLLQRRAQLPEELDWLSDAEQALRSKLATAKRRDDWTLGRWTAKRLAAEHYERPCEAGSLRRIEPRAAADGAPELFLDGAPAAGTLSLSHSGNLAVSALAPHGGALGCDLERVEPRAASFAETFFTEAERRAIEAGPAGEVPLRTTLVWSAKECALKALRQGLRLDTREVEVRFGEGEQAGWSGVHVRYAAGGREFHGRWRRVGEHVLVIATENNGEPPTLVGSGADSATDSSTAC